MYVSDVALDDFRSYRHALVKLKPGVCVFCGPNGQGKTNFVEALAFASTLSSHRVGADTALVRKPAEETEIVPAGAVVRLKVVREQRERILELEIISGKANRAKINRSQVRPRELCGELKTVTFAPEDLSLVKAEPGVRRKFLDDYLAQLNPVLGALKTEHDKVLRQRGALLKQLRNAPDDYAASTLSVWNEKLALLAAKLIIARLDFVSKLRPLAAFAHTKIAENGREFSCSYVRSVDRIIPPEKDEETEEELACRLEKAMNARRSEEIARGVNLVGAHRDELDLYLDHLPVRGYASHGESWSVALSLRLGAYYVLGGDSEEISDRPVLILDDVFAELDARRRQALAELVASAQQVLITVAVAEDLPDFTQAHYYQVVRDETEGTVITQVPESNSGVIADE
ncbi:DNA replication/repair protein RecF [Actinomycetaceae bacterium TAE3-ERU4]|nr:DNA replication/repair protein RecF [Actinomycetaceae bacterium TAE3-ERU4]